LDGTVKERIAIEYQETQIVERHYDGNDKLINTRTISTVHDTGSPDRHIEQKVNDRPEVTTDIHREGERTDVREQRFESDGKLEERSARQLDSFGARGATLKANGSSTSFITTMQCRDVSFRDNPRGSIHQRCDEDGKAVEETIEGPDGKLETIIRFTYTTDENGNWTRRSAESFRAGTNIGKAVTTREISYYESH
jgi:hypothetical protein